MPAQPNRKRLTDIVAGRTNPPTEGSITIWDTLVPGFGIRISSRGRRTWVCIYRVNGKSVMQTIGTMVLIPSVAEARELAREAQRKASTGVHPVEEKKQKAEAAAKAAAEARTKTFRALIEHPEKGFIKQHVERRELRDSTLRETQRILNRVMPYLGDKPAKEIKPDDIENLLDDIEAIRRRPRKGAGDKPRGEARTIQTCLTTVFKWALTARHIDVNPMVAIPKDRHGKTTARERTLGDDEIPAFWSAMESLGWPYGDIGKLLLLTGQRSGEVTGMRWSELDLTNRVWRLPGKRTKNKRPHVVYLSPQAMEIIEQQQLSRRWSNCDYVFSTTGAKAVSGFGNSKPQADAYMRDELGREPEHWTWHDLRRTAVTGMAEIDILPHIIEAVVNHISGSKAGIAGVYNKAVYPEQRKAAMAAWGRHVENLVRPDPNPETVVVPLRQPA